MLPKQILFFLILLLLTLNLSGCLMPDQGFYATMLDDQPTEYINVSEDRIPLFPYLKEAFQNPSKSISVPQPEFYGIRGVIFLHDIDVFYYDRTYYQVDLWFAD